MIIYPPSQAPRPRNDSFRFSGVCGVGIQRGSESWVFQPPGCVSPGSLHSLPVLPSLLLKRGADEKSTCLTVLLWGSLGGMLCGAEVSGRMSAEEIEARGEAVSCLRARRWEEADPGFEPAPFEAHNPRSFLCVKLPQTGCLRATPGSAFSSLCPSD